MKKILMVIGLFFLSVLTYFFSNVKEYYKFKHYCETEGGLKVYEPLERNVGWLVDDDYDARFLAKLDGVGFVRYKDSQGSDQDVRYIQRGRKDNAYILNASDSSYPINYIWRRKWEFVDESKKLKKSWYEVSSDKNKVLVEFYSFFYSKNGGSLGGPDWISCENTTSNMESWASEMKHSFKN